MIDWSFLSYFSFFLMQTLMTDTLGESANNKKENSNCLYHRREKKNPVLTVPLCKKEAKLSVCCQMVTDVKIVFLCTSNSLIPPAGYSNQKIIYLLYHQTISVFLMNCYFWKIKKQINNFFLELLLQHFSSV